MLREVQYVILATFYISTPIGNISFILIDMLHTVVNRDLGVDISCNSHAASRRNVLYFTEWCSVIVRPMQNFGHKTLLHIYQIYLF